MQTMWRNKAEPLKVGLHTRIICDLIDKAVNDFDEGKSTCLIINVPPRHGKSDCISKYEPAHFIATHPDKDVMIVSYNSSLATAHSKFSRDLLNTDEFKEVFPKIKLSSTKAASDSWGVENGIGTVTASGLMSGITGKGYHFGILDDYCASRTEAESTVMREKMWDSFTNDFLTRQAPVSITIILATPWHVDDIVGRIKSKNDKKSPNYDPGFKEYKVVKIPAKNGSVEIKNSNGEVEIVNYDYLFTEHILSTGEKIEGRFTPEYYENMFASLGAYSSQALMQCEPTVRGGNLIDVSKIKIHKNIADFPQIKYYRVWDLAHSEKQRMKDDPDWTSGTLLGFRRIYGVLEMWIKDVARIRAKAPERDNFIRAISAKDGQSVTIGVEASLDSWDAIGTMQTILNGRRVVKEIHTVGDKVSRMSVLEPVFEAGNVHILEGEWNADWLIEVKEFPSGKHDDQIDNMSAGHTLWENTQKNVGTIPVVGI